MFTPPTGCCKAKLMAEEIGELAAGFKRLEAALGRLGKARSTPATSTETAVPPRTPSL
jgi:hypothetical protein